MSETLTDTASEPRALTSHVTINKAIALVNPQSGGVGPRAAGELETLLSRYACETEIVVLENGQFDRQIGEAIAAKPDLLIVLAGDGTARAVASRAGRAGPLVAPLPGGTMNMLPKALYGTGDWKAALEKALDEGGEQFVSGGVVEGEAFYCAAIFGAPALWAPAREAMRSFKISLAISYARRAWKRAFSGHIRYVFDGKPRRKAEAVVLISPMISKVMDDPVGLEGAAMTPSDATQAFRLAGHALFDDWRQDPAVTTQAVKTVELTARSRIPAVIDGEPTLLPHTATVKFMPKAFRALAPMPPAAEDSV